MTRLLALSAAIVLAVAACGGDDASGSSTATTLPPLATTSAAPDTTLSGDATVAVTDAPTTTVLPATTVASGPTTTAAPGAALTIESDRLGSAIIGASATSVIDYMTGVLGPVADDQGWQDVQDTGLACPGDRVRFATWGDGLTLFFTDDSAAASGPQHFAGYTYSVSETMSPAGITTTAGIGLGSTVDALLVRHPGTVLNADDVFGVTAQTSDGILVHLSGPADDDLVTSFSVGDGCGE